MPAELYDLLFRMALCVHRNISDGNQPLRRHSQIVQAAKQCGFPCSGRPEYGNYLILVNRKADIRQNLRICIKLFIEMFNLYQLCLCSHNFPNLPDFILFLNQFCHIRKHPLLRDFADGSVI